MQDNTYQKISNCFNHDIVEGPLSDPFQYHIFSKFNFYDKIKYSVVCKHFFNFINYEHVSRIKKLDPDLRRLILKSPSSSLSVLELFEDIQNFRNLWENPGQKIKKILTFFGLENVPSQENQALTTYINRTFQSNPFKLNISYQGLKENLFDNNLIKKCPENIKKTVVLFTNILCHQTTLNLLRTGHLNIKDIFIFLNENKIANNEPNSFNGQLLYVGFTRLKNVLSLQTVINGQQSLTDFMNTRIKDIKPKNQIEISTSIYKNR